MWRPSFCLIFSEFCASDCGSLIETLFFTPVFYLSEELARIQKRALRIIFPYASYNSALQEARIPSLYDRRASLSSDLCSHLKLCTIGICTAIESLTCQCARLIVLKNLLLLAIA